MVDIQKANVGQAQLQQDVQVKAKDKEVGDQGVVAKGVGLFKKAWLHMSGNAGNRHSQQLTNLRAQVKTKFGDDGLTHLNKELQKKNFTTDTDVKKDTSTKLLSDSEIKSLMGSVEIEARVNERAGKIRGDLQTIVDTPKLLDALHTFAKKEFSDENTQFLKELNALTKKKEKDVSLDDLTGLYNKFIPMGSERQINLYFDNSELLKGKFDALQTAMHNDDNEAIDTAKKELISALDNEAKSEIFKVLKQDTIPRATADPDFKKVFHDHAYNEIKKEVLEQNLEQLGMA